MGHSTRSSDEFVNVLEAHGIEAVLDVRRLPGSRRLPQFDSATLGETLAVRGIAYRWIPALGGRRRPRPDSPSNAWRNASFSAYADHAWSEEFADGLFELLMVANGLRTVVMCAEILWWRCHRRIIADVLTSIGYRVEHVRDEGPTETHQLMPPARIVGGGLTYGV
jgi:uncharacterized protein (DUF488 family)